MTSAESGERLFPFNDDNEITQKKEISLPRRTIYYLKEDAIYA
jgi:hypothetical protein